MPTRRFPCLTNATFAACIADNDALGIHRAGYNGLASLIPHGYGNNLLVPTSGGLNYETIWLAGMTPYEHPGGSRFEPRCEPMAVESADRERVVLFQPETAHAHVSARITFQIEEPHYLHQRIELTFHRRFAAPGERQTFRSLWANYLHMPPDRHLYLKTDESTPDLTDWVGVTKEDHSAPAFRVGPLPADREIAAAEHLALLAPDEAARLESAWSPLPEWAPMEVCAPLDGPLRFFYGLCPNDYLFLLLFRQPERFRFSYSPCGAGKTWPHWCPAWDFSLFLEEAQVGTTYAWDLCLALKEYAGRADVMDEVRRYRARYPPS